MTTDDTLRAALDAIVVTGAHEHNLKWVDVRVPHGTLAVVTGVSGSGKSSLAFDTIAREGRRRYLETFSSYARQFLGALARPAARDIAGLSPTVAVEQSDRRRQPAVDRRHDDGALRPAAALLGAARVCAGRRRTGPRLERRLFSFNSPHGACPACKGLGVEDRLDPDLLVSDPSKTVRGGALRITTPTGYLIYSQVTIDVLDQVCRAHGFSVDLPWQALTPRAARRHPQRLRSDSHPVRQAPARVAHAVDGHHRQAEGGGCLQGHPPGDGADPPAEAERQHPALRALPALPGVRRHAPPARGAGGDVRRDEHRRGRGAHDRRPAAVLRRRADFDRRSCRSASRSGGRWTSGATSLQRLGLDYLTLDRESTTLSAGEAQRVRLAALAGIGLQGVLFVLDEPSVGLHHHDTGLLLDVIRGLRDRGNTVLVVEHDDQTILQADWIIDVGPGAGDRGRRAPLQRAGAGVRRRGQPGAAHRLADSRTRAFLTGAERIALPARRREGSGSLVVEGVTRHNLQGVRAEFRMGALNVVTGVSGAGKSTLVEETRRLLRGDGPAGPASLRASGPHRQDHRDRPGADRPDAALEPGDLHGRCSTACATCSRRNRRRSAWASARAASRSTSAAAAAKPARARASGRSGCSSSGTVAVTCESCDGRRFNDETLAVRYRGATIHDVLEMPIADALALFADQPPIARTLGTLDALGLGYLRVGHPATMLSGGEAQRVKLASELARPGTGRTLYILDEPTTGLHPADIVAAARRHRRPRRARQHRDRHRASPRRHQGRRPGDRPRSRQRKPGRNGGRRRHA